MDRVDYESLIIQDLLNFYNTKALDIKPWYQRRSVWSPPQKAYLVNTIVERKPVPSIYIRHHIDIDTERSIKEVVDGQQRIRSIISFRDDEFSVRHPNHNRKVKYSELSSSEKRAFLSTSLAVGYLIGATDQDVIEIFGRINSISKSLNPQEKRNAQYSGEFKQFCLRQATDRLPFWRATNIFSANEIARMQEVQFVSDLVINLLEGLRDYNAGVITQYYKGFDADFPNEDDISDRLERIFSRLVALPTEDFVDTIFNSAQISFSLMIVLDRMRDIRFSNDKIHSVIWDIDSRISAYADPGVRTAIEARYLEGFTGGNLHRIRSRRIRDEILVDAFS